MRIEIQLRERLYHREQPIVLVHLVDLLVKIQAADNILNIGREALDVCLKVGRQVVGVVDQLCKIKLTGIVELESGQTVHRFRRIIWIRLIGLHDLGLRGRKSALKAADDDHRNDDILVFIALICTTQLIGDGPYKIHLCRNVYRRIVPHCIDYLFISHAGYLAFHSAELCCLIIHTHPSKMIRTRSFCQSSFCSAGFDRGHRRSS